MRQLAAAAALICAASWGLYLLAFWPGILSDDSLDQWRQLLTLNLTSYHPPFHTLSNWLATRPWETPGMVGLVQIAALSLLVARVVVIVLGGRGSRPLLVAGVALMAVLPVHGLFAITLWKDIPYACAVVWLTWQMVTLVRTRGAALSHVGPLLALVAALAATALYRHNGLPVAVASILMLAWCLPGSRARLAIVAALAFGLIAGTQAALVKAFDLAPLSPVLRYQAPIHQLGALVVAGAYDSDPAARTALERLQPRSGWEASYECTNVVPLLKAINVPVFEADVATYRRLWWRGVTTAPGIVARHVGCVSGMIWHPLRRPHAFGTMGIAANSLGLETRPVSTLLHGLVYRWAAVSTHATLSPVLWGPAFYLHVVLVCTVIAWRRGGMVLALPFVPALVHSAVLILAIPSAEYRLQYPVVIVGTFAPALLSILRRDTA